jgi:hypothetical protein
MTAEHQEGFTPDADAAKFNNGLFYDQHPELDDRLPEANEDIDINATERAAVRPEPLPPMTVEQSREAVDAALRARGPQPPLTAGEIAARRGGQAPTAEEVEGINKARANGLHLS